MVAVVRAVEEQQRVFLSELIGRRQPVADRDHAHAVAASGGPGAVAQRAALLRALRPGTAGSPRTQGMLDDVIDAWLTPGIEYAAQQGLDPERTRLDTRLGIAVVRGLLLDLLATQDRESVDAAYERFLELYFRGRNPAHHADAGCVPGQRVAAVALLDAGAEHLLKALVFGGAWAWSRAAGGAGPAGGRARGRSGRRGRPAAASNSRPRARSSARNSGSDGSVARSTPCTSGHRRSASVGGGRSSSTATQRRRAAASMASRNGPMSSTS